VKNINLKMNNMKTKIFLLLTLAITITGCDKDNDNTETIVDGNYIGVFERAGNTSDVELSINNGTWTGESETEKFPALCNGNWLYSIF
jgi:major membrane immunogen (membrane-anchored lipoprotein)